MVLDPSTAAPTPAGRCPGTPPASARSTATAPGPRSWSTRPAALRFEAVRGGGARVDGQPLVPSRLHRAGRGGRRAVRATRRSASAGSSSGRSAPSPSTCARSPAGGSTPTSTAARAPTGRGTTSAGCSSARRPARWSSTPDDRELVTTDHAARRTPVAAATPALLDAGGARRAEGSSTRSPGPGSARS